MSLAFPFCISNIAYLTLERKQFAENILNSDGEASLIALGYVATSYNKAILCLLSLFIPDGQCRNTSVTRCDASNLNFRVTRHCCGGLVNGNACCLQMNIAHMIV